MIRNLVVCSLFFIGVIVVPAAGLRAADTSNTSLAARLVAAQKEAADAEKAFVAATKDFKKDQEPTPEMRRLAQAYDDAIGKGFQVASEAINADPSSSVSFDGLIWVLNIDSKIIDAIAILAKHHAGNPKIGETAFRVAFNNRSPRGPEFAPTTDLLNAIVKKNDDSIARGFATYGLAIQAKNAFYESERAGMPTAEQDRLAKTADDAHARVLKDFANYPDVLNRQEPTERTIKEATEATLFELRHLRVGQAAPDIEAKDIDGKPMKLSDYKGKVVLLDFWAAWCPVCVDDIPHQVAITKLLEGKPFAIVGVNGDDKAETARQTAAKFKTTWRSFWNGADGQAGPITNKWNVQSWPTTYVIDAKGIIRARQVHGPDLDVLLQKLVAEVETATK